jgi:DNA-binding NtrC family response regulator
MKSRTVLVAYQEDGWVESLAASLRDAGYRVERVQLVSDLLKRVRNGAAKVVLRDDEVEGVKACDIASLLKRIDGEVQVIGVSSEESVGSARRLRGAGIFYQAMKPVDMEELRSAVACAFEKVEREESGRWGFWSFLVPGRVPA